MSLYAERLYTGPDIRGQTFTPDHCAHCLAWENHHREIRLEKMRRDALRAHGRSLRYPMASVTRLSLVQ